MAKFVIHKRGFFYTDESFELCEGVKGSIVGIFENLDDAKNEKVQQDILSMQRLSEMNAVDFFFDSPNYDEIYEKLEDYYKKEFNITIDDKYYFDFPDQINEEQAKFFLNVLNISFHDVIEYGDDEVLDPDDFNLEDEELGEF